MENTKKYVIDVSQILEGIENLAFSQGVISVFLNEKNIENLYGSIIDKIAELSTIAYEAENKKCLVDRQFLLDLIILIAQCEIVIPILNPDSSFHEILGDHNDYLKVILMSKEQ